MSCIRSLYALTAAFSLAACTATKLPLRDFNSLTMDELAAFNQCTNRVYEEMRAADAEKSPAEDELPSQAVIDAMTQEEQISLYVGIAHRVVADMHRIVAQMVRSEQICAEPMRIDSRTLPSSILQLN